MPDLLDRIDRIMAELAEVRAELAQRLDPDEFSNTEVTDADDLAPDSLLDTHAAAARFGYSAASIARWCRDGDGVRRGGRWLVSIPKLQRRLNGK